MGLNLRLNTIIKGGKWDTLLIRPDGGEEYRVGRSTYECETVLTRAKARTLLSKLKKEPQQGTWEGALGLLIDLRIVKTLPLDVEYVKNQITIWIGGTQMADLGDDLKLGHFRMKRIADDNVEITFRIHGSVHSSGLAWINDNPEAPLELRVIGPGEEYQEPDDDADDDSED